MCRPTITEIAIDSGTLDIKHPINKITKSRKLVEVDEETIITIATDIINPISTIILINLFISFLNGVRVTGD